MKSKEIIIYILTITFNISFGFLFNLLIFKGDKSMFIFSSCGVALLLLTVNQIISSKMNYKLDIFTYNITDLKHLIFNSIFIGGLFSIPISMFITLIL